MQGNSFDTLFNAPKIDSTFLVQKGDLSGIDFVRALQSPSRDGVQGGKTKFDDLSGNLAVNGSRYTFTNVRLIAGLLSASGAGEVLPNREINGRVLRGAALPVQRGQGQLQGNRRQQRHHPQAVGHRHTLFLQVPALRVAPRSRQGSAPAPLRARF